MPVASTSMIVTEVPKMNIELVTLTVVTLWLRIS